MYFCECCTFPANIIYLCCVTHSVICSHIITCSTQNINNNNNSSKINNNSDCSDSDNTMTIRVATKTKAKTSYAL